MIDEFHRNLDSNSRAYFAFMMTSRWLGFRLDTLSSLFLAFTCYFAMVVGSSIDARLLGLSLTYTLQLVGLFQVI